MEVSLPEMLEAREQRAFQQMRLIRQYHLPIISFSLNIPGPVKDSPLIRRGFEAGVLALDHRLPKGKVIARQIIHAVTGCEAIYVMNLDAVAAKKITTAIEDDHPLGRLFDMDVIGLNLQKLDREVVGGKSRNCLICGAPGRSCASRRLHTVAQLQQKVHDILSDYFRRKDREKIGSWAVQSLLDEVCTTPKPGLVDHRNSGSHQDMDIFTFIASAASLGPYFETCVGIGQCTQAAPPEETFLKLRQAGLRAEETMQETTAGVNTHKGAIFTMGLLCGSAGRLWNPEGTWNLSEIFQEISHMTKKELCSELNRLGSDTVGERLYHENGISGIRGEAAAGFPSVETMGLPVFRQLLAQGLDKNMAGAVTLLHLIANVIDTNMISRGGLEGARRGAEAAGRLIAPGHCPTWTEIAALDQQFIAENLSPGGCADLLAAVYFVDHFS